MSGIEAGAQRSLAVLAREVAHTLWPPVGAKDGPLPPLLVALTFTTGVVDSTSYLLLGHVFVANMTGNVVLLGFAVAGAPALSITAPLTALAAFLAGAAVAGRLGVAVGSHRGVYLRNAVLAELLLLAGALTLDLVAGGDLSAAARYPLIVLLGLAMGMQNSTARRLAVPDLSTTVLTLTLVGFAADSRLAGGPGHRSGRRLLAVTAMFLGALTGGLLALHVSLLAPLALALATLTATAVAAAQVSRSRAAWTRPAR